MKFEPRLFLGPLVAPFLLGCPSTVSEPVGPAPEHATPHVPAAEGTTQATQTEAVETPDVADAAEPLPPTSPPSGATTAEAPPSADYVVAEWGVFAYDSDGGELATAPSAPAATATGPAIPPRPRPKPPRIEPAAVKKPVIYLRPGSTWKPGTPVTIEVTMAQGGRLHEVWPTPDGGPQPAHGASFSWTVDGIAPGSCGKGWGPKVSDAPCSSLPRPDGCEAAEFETWVAESDSCLDVGGVAAPALLYNGFPGDRTAPVVVSDTSLTNGSNHAVGPVFVNNTSGGYVVIERLEAGATMTLPVAKGSPMELLDAIRGSLLTQGLSESEAADFMRAWTPMLSAVDTWRVFGFFGPDAIESVSSLVFSPRPKVIHRVMAFTLEP